MFDDLWRQADQSWRVADSPGPDGETPIKRFWPPGEWDQLDPNPRWGPWSVQQLDGTWTACRRDGERHGAADFKEACRTVWEQMAIPSGEWREVATRRTHSRCWRQEREVPHDRTRVRVDIYRGEPYEEKEKASYGVEVFAFGELYELFTPDNADDALSLADWVMRRSVLPGQYQVTSEWRRLMLR
jgi:hypothetical protein